MRYAVLSLLLILSDSDAAYLSRNVINQGNNFLLIFSSTQGASYDVLRSWLILFAPDPNWSALIRSEKPNRALQRSNLNYSPFQNLQILQTIPYRYNVNHTLNSLQLPSSLISSLGVYSDRWGLSYPFPGGVRVHHLTSAPELRETKFFKALPN